MAKTVLLAAWFFDGLRGEAKRNVRKTIDHAREMLRNNGYKVIVCDKQDGEEVISMYKKHEPDVLVLEVGLHKMDGIAVLKQLKEHQKDAAVIFFSSYGQESIIRECILSGASGFVAKNSNNMQKSIELLINNIHKVAR